MTLIYYDSRFLDHDTGPHPECAQRLRTVMQQLDQTGLTSRCLTRTWQPLEQDQLQGVHLSSHLDALEALAAAGGGRADPDTVVAPASVDIARLAAGAVCDATRAVLEGAARNALCLVRPPGHHAQPACADGYCFFNNIAVAIECLRTRGGRRTA